MKNIHQCRVCLKTFSLLRYLRKHVTILAVGDQQLSKCQRYYSETCNLQEHLQVNHKTATDKESTDETNCMAEGQGEQLISTNSNGKSEYSNNDDCANIEDELVCLKFEPDEEDELYYFDRHQQSLPPHGIITTSPQRSVNYEDRTKKDNTETISMQDGEQDKTPTIKHTITTRQNTQIRGNGFDGSVVNTIQANLSTETTICKKCKLPCISLENLCIHYETLHKLPVVSLARVNTNHINLKCKRAGTGNSEESIRKTKTHKCDICSKMFTTLRNLKRHKSSTHGEKLFICNVCQKAFQRLDNLKQHKLVVHNNVKYKCNICQDEFKGISNLKRHKSYIHEQIGFKCDICPKQFRTSHDLGLHKASAHEGVRYKCDMCDKQFRNIRNLREHKSSNHGNVLYDCDMCEKQFRYKQNLKVHKSSCHDDVRYKCDMCKKQFRYKQNLKAHKSSCHDGIRYKCDKCEKQFRHGSNLREHKLRNHDRVRHKCAICRKEYSYMRDLRRHESGKHNT